MTISRKRKLEMHTALKDLVKNGNTHEVRNCIVQEMEERGWIEWNNLMKRWHILTSGYKKLGEWESEEKQPQYNKDQEEMFEILNWLAERGRRVYISEGSSRERMLLEAFKHGYAQHYPATDEWEITVFGRKFCASYTAPQPPQNNALEFEVALRGLIAECMPKGLTVTEAVGTLTCMATDIQIRFNKANG